ncbi:uncharacterized protein [Leptinotarsa decemlineata]|uniref:uncharacterized protein n=1 Tax=Leptinotarsa decemlineata TaxID=7539 RepID=UPI003D30A940
MASGSGLLGTINTFDPNNSDFTVFSERLSQFFIANKVNDKGQKKAILLNSLSEQCYVLLRNLCVPDLPNSKNYDDLLILLENHFSPVKSFFAQRMKFYSARRVLNESVVEWKARVKNMASKCGFGSELQIVMRDIFVIGINEEKIMDRLFEEDASKADVTIQTSLKLALSKESALNERTIRESFAINSNAKEIKQEVEVNFNRYRYNPKNPSNSFHKTYTKENSSWGATVRPKEQNKNYRQGVSHPNQSSKCTVCGRFNHFPKECSYKECICHKCGDVDVSTSGAPLHN